MQQIPERAVKLVTRYFNNLTVTEKNAIPAVLKSRGTWMPIFDGSILGTFYLNEAEQQRVARYLERGWPPFPGFMVGQGKKPAFAPVAMTIAGSCHFFSSNHTSDLLAFEVFPGSSFTVADHFHEIRDSSGEEFQYHVALAFVLGISRGEQWRDVKRRLSELLSHSMGVWAKLR